MDKYDEKAKEVLDLIDERRSRGAERNPGHKFPSEIVAAALRENAAEAYEDAAKEIQDGIGVIDFYTIRKNIRSKAAALRSAAPEKKS